MSLVENIFWAGMVQENLQPMNRGMCFHKQTCVFQSSKKWDKRKNKEQKKRKKMVGDRWKETPLSLPISHFFALTPYFEAQKKYLILAMQVSYVGPKLSLNQQNNGNNL